MTIEKNLKETTLTVKVSGGMDTTTAPELETSLNESYAGVKELILDFKDLEYISSAGLRVILQAQKTMENQGSMKVIHANEEIMEVFDITGFVDILTIE